MGKRNNLWRSGAMLFAMILCIATAVPVWANVYASRLEQAAPDTTSYILNEDANNGVTVEVWKVGGGMVYSEAIGPQTKGTHNWTWNGTGYTSGDTFKLKVVASSAGYGGWTKITTDSTLNNFYSSRGVDVNRDQGSKYFGRIYVGESAGGTTGAGRATQDGIYMLNADVTDADGQGNTARNGGIAFGTTNSPFRVVAGPENKVYVTDWSDTNSSLIVGDADFNSAAHLLDNTGRTPLGKCANHGSIPTVYVEGTGANRVVYTMDEDFDAGADTTKGGIGSILKYDVGTTASGYAGQPSIQYDDGGWGTFKGNIQNYYNDMVRASDGTWWVSEDRSGSTTDTLTSLMQISADGSTVLWKSVPGLGATSSADPLRRTRGLAWDPVNDVLALGTYNAGKILIFDDDTKTILATITVASNATVRDVAFDAAGNLYMVDNITERMQIYSPGGANGFTTESYFTITPEPATILLLSLPIALLRRRRA